MRAAVYRGAGSIQIEDIPIPQIGSKEVLVQVKACGVCGTDLKKIQYGLVPPPRIFGHETSGVIAAVGDGIAGWNLGDRVAINHHVPCMKQSCHYCRKRSYAQCPVYKTTGATAGFEPAGGGYAEYVRVLDWCAESGMVRIPYDISFEEATFVEPLNTCLKGVRMAGIEPADTVLIIGQGPIGMLFTQLCKTVGAQVVVSDKSEERLTLASRLGADEGVIAESDNLDSVIRKLSDGRGADVAIVAVPSTKVVQTAFKSIRPGGKVLLFAQTRLNDPLEVDAGAVCMLEKSLIGSYSSDITLQDEAAYLIFSRKVDVRSLISHSFPLEQINDAIDAASHPRGNSMKIMVVPNS